MNTTVYRSVKLVVQNSTNESLSVQGVAVLKGRWADKMEPPQGGIIKEQSAVEWKSVSTELGTGTSGFLRLGSSHGYLTLKWGAPWTGRFSHHVSRVNGLTTETEIDDSQPDSVVMTIAISSERKK